MTKQEVVLTLKERLKGIVLKERMDEFVEFLNSLNFVIEPMRMRSSLGFANDKLYINIDRLAEKDEDSGMNGAFLLMVLLHEIGHMVRLTANDNELRDFVDKIDDFEAYFETVLVEEDFAETYASEQFEKWAGYPIPERLLQVIPDKYNPFYKDMMQQVFEQKQTYGTWAEYLIEIEKID